ncbi:hypothetical protein SJAV_26900 [Sulfurisphaera javensis]|uniref:CRISPR type III-B/RAMP module-associated protein Cmr5 n=1 Tax=Sulfurisphaera javensis TaxID=2049879 RepID=A0AAT9GVH7_9CREN
MSLQQTNSIEKLLDDATELAISASRPSGRGNKPEVDKSTVENLLSYLQLRKNINELLAYIIRQMGRGEIDKETGSLLLSKLRGKDYETAVTFLGYFKWIYEALTSRELQDKRAQLNNVKEFKKLVEILSR